MDYMYILMNYKKWQIYLFNKCTNINASFNKKQDYTLFFTRFC